MRRKNIFFGMIFATANLAWRLAQDLLLAVILAVRGRSLPFWQLLLNPLL